ncbi:MAG: ABC transporter permease [Trueperaceae bacterium]|nr:ABC transporter permease [Trueperaceae bacterium]MCC6311162.1 ABC transporter permease [Trueperaceae bacterium]MCO5173661.1 ABC transporter permease [Trueperaceae bacterium]MCW5820038.1 ABC transporter permease [Trueperaceae bacterium]
MFQYVLRRGLWAIPTLLGVFTIIFLLTYLMPGDPVRAVMGEQYKRADPATIERVRDSLGLNDPWIVQYGRFLVKTASGDLGKSFVLDEQVTGIIGYRFPRTLQLMSAALVVAILIGIPSGILAARYQYTWIDHTLMLIALLGVAMPVFWQAVLAKIFLTQDTYGIALFPVAGYGGGSPLYLVLPALVLGTQLSATIARVMRSSLLEERRKDYSRTARSKGLGEPGVIFRHELRNAMIPVVTIIGLDVGYLLGGSVVTETVFNWPGLGRAVVTAISRRDAPVIIGTLVFGALLFVAVNIVVDIFYAVINPQIRYA